MATVVFKVGDNKLVATSDAKFCNLSAGRNKNDEIDRVLQRNPAYSRYVSLSHNPSIPITTVTLFKKGEATKKANGKIDLAALFSVFCLMREVSDAIFVGRAGDSGLAVAIGIKDGVPFAEACGDTNHVSMMANEYYAMFHQGAVVYGDQSLFEGTEINSIDIREILDTVLASKDFAGVKKQIRVHYNGIPPLYIWIGVLIVLGILGGKYYLAHEEEIQKEIRRRAAVEAERANNDPIVVYGRDQEAAYQTIFKGCNKNDAMQVVRQIMNLPLDIAGWAMVEAQIHCDVGDSGARGGDVTYARRGGTNGSLSASFPNMRLTFSPDMSLIKVNLPVPDLDEERNIIPKESLMDVYSFMVKKGTVFQIAKSILDVTVTLTDPIYINGADPPDGYNDNLYLKGNITATGKLEYLEPFLIETSGVILVNSIKIIDIKPGQLPEFSLQGTYYVKKNPEQDITHQG